MLLFYGHSSKNVQGIQAELPSARRGDGKRLPYGTSYHHPLGGVVLAGGLKAKL
jgi:hypothetical protein